MIGTPESILILGASELQLPMIARARHRGLRTGVVDLNPAAPGVALAGEFFHTSTVDVAGVIAVARRFRPDGVTTMATDMPMRAVAAACQALGLPGLTPRCAEVCTDKGLMMAVFQAAGLPAPWFRVYEDPHSYLAGAVDLAFPHILKPVDSSGSRGVIKVAGAQDMMAAFDYACGPSRQGRVIAQELMSGAEVSVEIMAQPDGPTVVAVTGKVTTGAPHFVEIGHYQPADLPEDQREAVCDLAMGAVRALGVSTGAAHVEIMVTRAGPRLIEVGARLGGDYITSHLTPLSTGVSLIDAALDAALGHVVDIRAGQRGGSAIRYVTPTGTGLVRSVEGLDEAQSVPGVVEARALKGEGYSMSGLRSSADRVGYVIAEGRTAAEAVQRCEDAIARVHVRTQSDPACPDGSGTADGVHPREDR